MTDAKVYYNALSNELTVDSARASLSAIEELFAVNGVPFDTPLELWQRPDEFMFAAVVGSTSDIEKHWAAMRAEGWE